jgi:hypothetical protein
MLRCDVLVTENSRLLIMCINQTLLLPYLNLVDYWCSGQTTLSNNPSTVTPCENKIFLSMQFLPVLLDGMCSYLL